MPWIGTTGYDGSKLLKKRAATVEHNGGKTAGLVRRSSPFENSGEWTHSTGLHLLSRVSGHPKSMNSCHNWTVAKCMPVCTPIRHSTHCFVAVENRALPAGRINPVNLSVPGKKTLSIEHVTVKI
jgi:hypothetical protein